MQTRSTVKKIEYLKEIDEIPLWHDEFIKNIDEIQLASIYVL
jgi:hypothetical protein